MIRSRTTSTRVSTSMRGKPIDQQTAAWGLLIGLWQRRFIDQWTVGEVIDWRDRFAGAAKATDRAADASAGKGAARGRTSR